MMKFIKPYLTHLYSQNHAVNGQEYLTHLFKIMKSQLTIIFGATLAGMDVVKLTSELVNIDSDSSGTGEKEIAKYISGYLEERGIKSEITQFEKGRCNVVAVIGKGERLLLNGHIDTVPIGDPKKWRYGTKAKIIGDKMYGRGTSDMKGGVASILTSLPDPEKVKKGLVLTFVADEERLFLGSTWLLTKRKDLFKGVRYGIIAEPTDLKIQIAQKGIMDIHITVKGKSAHASRPWLGRSAIVDMSRFLLGLEKLSKNFKVKDRMLGTGTLNAGTIKGGVAPNVVPDCCEIDLDRRLVPGEDERMVVSQIKSIMKELKIDYDMDVKKSRPPFALDQQSFLPKFMGKFVPVEYTSAPGYTEAELYKSLGNIDCVVYGPGDKEVIHKENECVSVQSLYTSQKYFTKIISAWCQS